MCACASSDDLSEDFFGTLVGPMLTLGQPQFSLGLSGVGKVHKLPNVSRSSAIVSLRFTTQAARVIGRGLLSILSF